MPDGRASAPVLDAYDLGNGSCVVSDTTAPAADGLDLSILESLAADGVQDSFSNNSWIGRVGL